MDATPPPALPVNPMSMMGRLLNLLSAPGEVFEGIVASRFAISNWLIPAALAAVIGLICQWTVFSQPALLGQIQDIQDRAIQQQVDTGKMTPEQAGMARNAMRGEMVQTIMKISGAIFSLIHAVVGPIWWAFLLWLVGRWVFRVPTDFSRLLEVGGLASLITTLGGMVGTFLALGMGTLAVGPHLGVFVKDFDFLNRLHIGLCAVNVFGLWHLFILSVGLSAVLRRPLGPVLVVLAGLWVGYKAIAVILGLGQFVL